MIDNIELNRIQYEKLNSRQKENYNFAKASAVLAEYGYITFRLSDDWQGADFIAQHIDGEQFLKIQLKSRLCFDKKYIGKNIYIMFRETNVWYLYPHDKTLKPMLEATKIGETKSWQIQGSYSFVKVDKKWEKLIAKYRIGS